MLSSAISFYYNFPRINRQSPVFVLQGRTRKSRYKGKICSYQMTHNFPWGFPIVITLTATKLMVKDVRSELPSSGFAVDGSQLKVRKTRSWHATLDKYLFSCYAALSLFKQSVQSGRGEGLILKTLNLFSQCQDAVSKSLVLGSASVPCGFPKGSFP